VTISIFNGDFMNDLIIQVCSNDDLDLLAVLNKQLIEDEQHDNKMNIEQLKERMEGFINTDYKAYLFKENGEVRGYALVNHRREPLYLRHFFICRNCRRQGYGKLAFEKLIDLLGTNKIDIEVMHWNERGYEFWKSLGFKERSIYMRLEK
jgi:GNAT superfamily N-acetyltransferase